MTTTEQLLLDVLAHLEDYCGNIGVTGAIDKLRAQLTAPPAPVRTDQGEAKAWCRECHALESPGCGHRESSKMRTLSTTPPVPDQSPPGYRYRKRPVIIEAFQMTEARRYDNTEWPHWLNEAWNKPTGAVGAVYIDPDDASRHLLCVGTLEGTHRIGWNDFIIQGVKGELYPCKPDIFALTYEPEPIPQQASAPDACVCPFPRDKCPRCAHPCGACEAASLAPTQPAAPTSGAGDACPSTVFGAGRCIHRAGHDGIHVDRDNRFWLPRQPAAPTSGAGEDDEPTAFSYSPGMEDDEPQRDGADELWKLLHWQAEKIMRQARTSATWKALARRYRGQSRRWRDECDRLTDHMAGRFVDVLADLRRAAQTDTTAAVEAERARCLALVMQDRNGDHDGMALRYSIITGAPVPTAVGERTNDGRDGVRLHCALHDAQVAKTRASALEAQLASVTAELADLKGAKESARVAAPEVTKVQRRTMNAVEQKMADDMCRGQDEADSATLAAWREDLSRGGARTTPEAAQGEPGKGGGE